MPQALPMVAYYLAGTVGGATAGWATFAAFVTSVVVADYQKTRAAERSRAAAAAARRDRNITIRSGVAPRKLVLGTARIGGPLMYGEFVGTNEEFVDAIVGLTHGDAGPLTEILGVYFDDEYVAAADIVDDVPTTGKYSGTEVQAQRLTWSGAAALGATSVTLSDVPNDPLNVQAVLQVGSGDSESQYPLEVASVVGAVVTFTVPLAVAGTVWVTYSSDANPDVPVRVQWMLGTTTQASTTWSGVSTPLWTADHRLRGVSHVRTLMRPESEAFTTGMPQVSVVARGVAGVYDPRTDEVLTTPTTNPALLAAWFRTLPRKDGGIGVPSDWINWTTVGTAANVCDELISVKQLDDSGYENVKRYECNTVLDLAEQAPEDNLRIILDSMAGDFPFTAGEYRCYAGAFRAAALTITDDDVAGDQDISFAPNSAGDQAPPNMVSATIYSAAHNWSETAAPAVVNDTYVTADGQEEPTEIDLPATTDLRQANYLMGVRLEQMRPALVGSLTLKGVGADVALMDTLQLDLVGYEDLAGLTFEVRRRTNHWNGNYTVELREVKASTYALDADRFTPPNTDNPGSTSARPLPVAITSVANASLLQSDGGRIDRALVTWAEPTQPMINPAGWIDVRYRAPGSEWVYAPPVPGYSTKTYLSPLSVGEVLFIEARSRNGLGATSEWTGTDPFTVTGANDVPPDMASLAYAIKPGQVLVTWAEQAFVESVLRVGATWATATLLWSGVGTDYKHARPPNGTYKLWGAHRSRAGVYSATPVSIDITVDDSIDAGGGGTIKLTPSRFPFFSFSTGTTHTASAPGDGTLTITAKLANLAGTPTITAEAFDAASASLGAVTLGGSGLTRTLTAAQFTAPGTSGSVRTVVVTGTLGGSTDTLTVYRQDSTTTAPRLYLDNPFHPVATDEQGDFGDYTDATTLVEVYAGLSNDTALWSFAITPDSGVTATINGGAGPVSGTGSVTVAVTDMTVPDGAVLVTASRATYADLTASFQVTKNESTGSYQVYWDPRAEIVLPLGADGAVSSFADAYSSLIIKRAGGVVDTPNWTYSKADSNVVSELGGDYLNRVDVTGVPALGTISSSVSTAISLPTGWTRPQSLTWGPLGWVAFGYHASTNWQRVQVSADFLSWTTVDVGTAGRWEFGAADDDGNVITVEFGVAGTNKILRSTDGGATWGAVGSLGASAQWYSVQWMGDRFLVTPNGSTAARQSTDGGASWSALTMPANNCNVFGGPGRYLAVSSSSAYYLSTNGGSTWGSSIAALSGINSYTAKLFKGRLVVIPLSGSTVYYSDDGAAWATSTLQHSVGSGPRFCQVVSGVLYLVGSDGKVQFTIDGKAWRYAGATATTGQQHLGLGGYVDIQAALLPNIYSTSGEFYVRTPLLATSEIEGFVTVTASKAGEPDIVRALPVRRGAVASGGFAFSAEPYTVTFPATSDGVVTDYSGGTITARASRDGVDDTSAWTWAYTTTNLTPSSGSSNVVTITAMDNAQDTGTINFSATRAGYQTITGTLVLRKAKGITGSGPRMGVGYAVIDTANTLIGVRFNSDGSVDVKRGSGGSYTRLTQWAGAVVTGVGSSYWIYIDPAPSTHALSTGTTDTWLALSSARTFEMSDATSGTHVFDAEVFIGSSSAGANAVGGSFSMRLIVP